MGSPIIFLSFLFVLLLHSDFSFGFHVLIDPGHGGTDQGAVRGNIIESKIAFNVAQKLIYRLKNTTGISVTQTRDSDKTLPLKDRVRKADTLNPDLFISIHVNSSEDRKAKGTEFYFATTQAKEYEDSKSTTIKEKIINDYFHMKRLYQSKYLAESIAEQNQSLDKNDLHRRKILQAPFFVISKTKVPSLLIELGFLTNPEEAQALTAPEHQEVLSNEIYDGIIKYIVQNQ